jgi:hypothetical protein
MIAFDTTCSVRRPIRGEQGDRVVVRDAVCANGIYAYCAQYSEALACPVDVQPPPRDR